MSKVTLSILFIAALAMTAALAAPDSVYIYTADWCNHRIVRVEDMVGMTSGSPIADKQVEYNIETVKFLRGNIPGAVYPMIDGLYPSGGPGEPALPMDAVRYELPGKWKISGLRLSSIRRREFEGEYFVGPNSEPVFVGQDIRKGLTYNIDKAIYSSNQPYPGTWIDYTAGYDGENTVVIARVYPLQWNPATKAIALLERAQIEIYGNRIEKNDSRNRPASIATNVIITTSEFAMQAENLRLLHGEWGAETEIAYCESIRAEYTPAEEPVHIPGYAHDSLRPYFLDAYDYDLARRIIAYLRDDSAHPLLESITILGDASDVPPSYYSYSPSLSDFEEWQVMVATDAFYASPDYDYIHNFGVGRLAAANPYQADTIIAKLGNTVYYATSNWMSKSYFSGGNTFRDPNEFPYYEGEAYVTNIHNSGYCDGLVTERSFSSEGGFTYLDWSSAWRRSDIGFYWIIAHGSGYGFAFDDHTDAMFGVADFLDYPASPPYPLFFDCSCTNGKFDQEIVSSMDTSITFAEAFIRGAGGGSMLVASTRIGAASAGYYIDGYETIIEPMRNLGLVGYMMVRVLSQSPKNCGEWFKRSMNYFVEESEVDSLEFARHTFFATIMHGDPAMPLPAIDTLPEHTARPEADIVSEVYDTTFRGIAAFFDSSGIVEITTFGGAAPIYAKVLDGRNESPMISSSVVTGGCFDFESPHKPRYNSVRIESADGKARWLYFLSDRGSIVPEGKLTDWDNSGIPPACSDPDDFAENYLELTELYAAIEGDYLYVAFPYNGVGDTIRGYVLCVDSKIGGAFENPDGDAVYTRVDFPTHGADYEIAFLLAYDWYGIPAASATYYYDYSDYLSEWQNVYSTAIDGIDNISYDDGTIEIAMNLDSLGVSDEVAVLVYSFPMSEVALPYYPSQDATPTNPGSYSSLTFTAIHNQLTEWLVLDLTGIRETSQLLPEEFALSAYPNPFNSAVKIIIDAPVGAIHELPLQVEIFDIAGRRVSVIARPKAAAISSNQGDCFVGQSPSRNDAKTEFIWQPDESLGSGVYLVRARFDDHRSLSGAETTTSKRIVYLK